MSKYRGGKSPRQDTRETTERDTIQSLKAVIRKLKKEIQRLRREVSRNSKAEETLDELLEEIETVEEDQPPKDRCPECGKGVLQTVDLGIRRLIKCDTCGHRKTVK